MGNHVEFWAIDENGNKHNECFKTKSSRSSKVKKLIEQKYKLEIGKCYDFGFRIIDG